MAKGDPNSGDLIGDFLLGRRFIVGFVFDSGEQLSLIRCWAMWGERKGGVVTSKLASSFNSSSINIKGYPT